MAGDGGVEALYQLCAETGKSGQFTITNLGPEGWKVEAIPSHGRYTYKSIRRELNDAASDVLAQVREWHEDPEEGMGTR